MNTILVQETKWSVEVKRPAYDWRHETDVRTRQYALSTARSIKHHSDCDARIVKITTTREVINVSA